MKKTMHYKGLTGSIEFSKEDGIFFGESASLNGTILYEGKDKEALKKDFHEMVDFCLEAHNELAKVSAKTTKRPSPDRKIRTSTRA